MQTKKPLHPLRLWMRSHPEFSIKRDCHRVFGVWHSFFYRVLSGETRPMPDRAQEWSHITGIPLEALLFYPKKKTVRTAPTLRASHNGRTGHR